jgi:hypothetical protein
LVGNNVEDELGGIDTAQIGEHPEQVHLGVEFLGKEKRDRDFLTGRGLTG